MFSRDGFPKRETPKTTFHFIEYDLEVNEEALGMLRKTKAKMEKPFRLGKLVVERFVISAIKRCYLVLFHAE